MTIQAVDPPAGVGATPSARSDPRTLGQAHRDVHRGGKPFLRRPELQRLEEGFGRAWARLREGPHEDPGTRAASEWLLDNYYLVRRVLGQLREELPVGFQERLPELDSRGAPRVRALAEHLYGGELDIVELEGFIDAYQESTALTIAELWALPAVIRLTVLEQLLAVLEGLGPDAPAPRAEVDAGSAAGRAVRALRLLAEVDWKKIFCRLSLTERILSEDPVGAYPAMDFDTRDAYRRAVEDIAWCSTLAESEVSNSVLEHARRAPSDSSRAHVGYWLLGSGRPALERGLGTQVRGLGRHLLDHPRLAFFGLLLVTQLALLAPIIVYLVWLRASVWLAGMALVLCWFPASVPASTLVHWGLSRLLRPRLLSKLDFSEGIPVRWRTLVAVPTLLGEDEDIDRLIAQLEVHFLANPDPQLRFALLTDHADTDTPPGPVHEQRLARAEQGVSRLNALHGCDGRGPFHLLHRESRFNESEGSWMGWERKRGKLKELNQYLRGAKHTSYAVHVGDPDGLSGIAFVLTLDSDTELPPGAAARLVGALAHPLNRPRADDCGRTVEGYTVIQPRVEISPRSARSSLFARLFSGDTGIDIYTRAVSEVYQDLFGEGIYVGKGIYDIDGFEQSLDERVPENALLSHDLFEGVHGRGALATDIVVYEDYPLHYPAYLHRLHRWIRGDWQLLRWLLPRVPGAGGGTRENTLGVVDRFKIADNLRRSLLAPALMALLLAGWFVLPGHPLVWTAAALLAPGAAALWTLARTGRLERQELGRWFLALCFAPQEASVVLDAIARVLTRTLWTHRRMLQWTTAARAEQLLAGEQPAAYLRRLWRGPATSVVLTPALAWITPETLPWAAPWLLLWLVSPEIARYISRRSPTPREELDEADELKLRRVARRTWLFFETFVQPAGHWLPPDFFQEHPRGEVAPRTSPTNVGMLLLAELAAYDFGYLGPAELTSWVENTLDGLDKLERHRGHIYNWYDTGTLEPLEPRYVSTVDSGNLAAALVTLAVGLEQLERDPPLRLASISGLRDTVGLLVEALAAWADVSNDAQAQAALERGRELFGALNARTPYGALLAEAEFHSQAIDRELLAALRLGKASHDPALLGELRLWLDRFGHQLGEARREAELLVPEIAGGEALPIAAIPDACRSVAPSAAGPAQQQELERKAAAADALSARLRRLAERARAFAAGMDFRFLYDDDRRLFRVGYSVSASRLDPHCYDLLASEARIASFFAIATHQVPAGHWFALGRPLTRAGRSGRALLSWGGSMFEYLMPRLIMESHTDTLLHQSGEAAVDRQIAYGRERRVPWGISESGYGLLDAQEAYQYRAFGVPGLGMRRGLDEDVVIAPYASLIALPFRPHAVVENLDRLERLGMFGRFGFFEALDYHVERRSGARPVRVREYMAHHQGMAFVAIDNLLRSDVMVRRFHADPRVRGWSLLLDERVPSEVRAEQPVVDHSATSDVALTPHAPLSGWHPEQRQAQLWAVGNGTLTAVLSADGGGGLFWERLAATRAEMDTTLTHSGSFLYLRDEDDGTLIGPTPEPLGDWPSDGRVTFEASGVEFFRRHDGLSIRTRIAVASDDAVEVREIEIANEGDRVRRVRVFGCLEPVLEPEREAARHPAFSKLFLRLQKLDELPGVLVTRAPRDQSRPPVLLFRVVAERECNPGLFEVDRAAFLGRRGGFHAPDALTNPHSGPAAGTLDPLCVCAAELELPPGARRAVAFVTALAPTSQEVLELGRRFASAHAVHWTFEDAARAVARRVQRFAFPPGLLPIAQRLLSALLVPNPALRAPQPVLAIGRPSQQKLWGRGVSGDDPILLVRVRGDERNEIVTEVLAIHRYLRELRVRFDVVFVDDAASGYADQGPEAMRVVLAEQGALWLLHQRGGVHWVRTDQTTAEELADLEAAARVYLDARRGPLAEQLDRRDAAPVELPPFEPAGAPPGTPPDPAGTLRVPTLAFDNGFGGFDGDEYVVHPGACPPAPWCNVLANQEFGCLVSEAGLGCTWSQNASENRLTPWYNDPVRDPPSEVLYLRDEETARLWSTTPAPLGVPTLVRHGHGYTSYELVCAGLEQTMTVFVPPDDPVKVVRLNIRNASARPRRLTATYYADWVLGTRRAESAPHIVPRALPQESCLIAENAWSADFAGRVAFVATDRTLHGWTGDRLEMMGRNGSLSRPAALRRWGLSGRVTPGLDACAVLQVHVDLGPGEETEVCFFVGQERSLEAALSLVRRLRTPGSVEAAWQSCRAYWRKLVGAVRIRTPDAALDSVCNGWLLYQSLACRYFGRAALYQSSGAYGFRDQLQDSLAFVQADPALTRAQLLYSAAHQFVEGDVLHWWHPPGDAGVRTRCSDDLLWLIYATAEYVEATGDVGVLRERVPFLSGDALRPGEHVRYARFASSGEATLLEHCRRAWARGFTRGAHGLPLIGDGDWNDGMDRVGSEGRGESVWLGWFVYACTERLATLLERADEAAEAGRCRERLPSLRAALSEHGWDGGWYRRAYHDDGTPVGSARSAPPHIDSIAQSWAALSGAGEPERVATALAAAERTLVRAEERLVLLLAPPFGPVGPNPGYIAAYPPGVRENGGQYTHAAAWLAWAYVARGDGRAAYRLFRLLNPLERTQSKQACEQYRVEPYVLAADVYGRPPFVGRGGWTWYTGAAGWTYRLVVEGLLGLRRRGGALEVSPCLPPDWPGFEASVSEGPLTVRVVVHAASVGQAPRVELDGQLVPRARVGLDGSGERKLELWLGQPAPDEQPS